jgi:TonB family protein
MLGEGVAVVRVSQRDRAFLISVALHICTLMLLFSMRLTSMNRHHTPDVDLKSADVADKAHTVWLPPHEVLRQLLPSPTRRTAPAPKPQAKDRISVGPRSDRRARELLLPRDVDLSAVPKGHPGGRAAQPAPSPAAQPGGAPKPQPAPLPDRPASDESSSARLYWPQRSASPAMPPDRTIGDAARHWGERLRDSDLSGLPSGTGQQIGPLFFDPAGADFTVWVNHFKDEVYRNWFVPQSVMMGQRGRVDLQMTVDRSGKIVDLRVERSSGAAALDRAAQNALLSSQLLPLPSDYGPPDVTMHISFLYNMRPAP